MVCPTVRERNPRTTQLGRRGPRIGDCPALAARPDRQVHIVFAFPRLHTEPRYRCRWRCLRARLIQNLLHPGARFRTQIQKHDRVKHHCRDAGTRPRQLLLEPRNGIGAIDVHRYPSSHLDCFFEPLEAIALVRPQERLQRQSSVFGERIDRVQVAPAPFGYSGVDLELRRLSGKHPTKDQWRIHSTPSAPVRLIPVIIPPEVEAGTGADLDKPQREAGAPRHVQKTRQQRTGALHLAGLNRFRQPRADLAAISPQRI